MFYKQFIKLFLLILLLSLKIPAESKSWWTAGFFLDNDLFAAEDDGYTNGLRFSFVSPDLSSFEDDEHLPQWLQSINRALYRIKPDEKTMQRNMVITIGQQIYTPDERFIARRDLVKEDRPYAGWLYLGLGYQLRNAHYAETTLLNLGVIGPAAFAQESQDTVHKLRGFARFNGWKNQLNNELGIQIIHSRKYKVFRHATSSNLATDLIYHWGSSLGNVATYLDSGIEWRSGWQLPEDFGTSSAMPGGDNSSPGTDHDPRLNNKLLGSVHAYAAINGRWVLRDFSLDGNTFSDSHSVNKEPLVATTNIGIVATISRFQLGFSRVFVTKEFAGQDDSRGYGAISLSYTYAFD